MQIVVSQDKQGACSVWSGTVELGKSKTGIVNPKRTDRLIGRITRPFCKRLFGNIPRPNCAIRFEVLNLGKEDIAGIGSP